MLSGLLGEPFRLPKPAMHSATFCVMPDKVAVKSERRSRAFQMSCRVM